MRRKPERIHFNRFDGKKLPPGAQLVMRHVSKWGNPHKKGDPGVPDNATAARLFEADLLAGKLPFSIEDVRRELAGLDLACACKPGTPCHGDVLLRIANS